MRKLIFLSSDEQNAECCIDAETGNVLASWFLDDAHWRGEYFGDILEALGAEEVDISDKFSGEELETIFINHLVETYGISEDDQEESDEEEIECEACTEAGGADKAVHHLPPACPIK